MSEVYQFRKENLGEDHKDTLEAYNWLGIAVSNFLIISV